MRIFILAERDQAYAQMCAGAARLGGTVESIRIGMADGLSGEIKDQADKIWLIPAQDDAMLEDYTETIAHLLREEKPEMLLVEPSKRGKLMAGRLAASLGTSVVTDVTELTPGGEGRHLVYGGAAVRREKAVTPTAIVTVGAGAMAGEAGSARSGSVTQVEFIAPAHPLKRVAREEKPKVSVDLTAAKRVIGVGRGIAQAADIEQVRELAAAIGGEVGCSRPIAEGEKWLPKEVYIGVSGLMLAPEVYMALGISGQVQHMVGCNRAKVMIAVNKDKNAPIFQQADYGIVADLYKVVPALIKRLKLTTH